MHYTSIENIHKVISPLFLEDLQKEFDSIRAIQVKRTRDKKLEEFQNKLASLTFLILRVVPEISLQKHTCRFVVWRMR